MTRREARRLIKRISQKADWIEEAMQILESLVKQKEVEFANELLAELIAQLESENGQLLRNSKNQKVISRLNNITESLRNAVFTEVVTKMFTDVSHITLENTVYYGKMGDKGFKPTGQMVKDLAFARLGFNEDGTLVRDGYMQGLFESKEVTAQIKDFVTRGVYSRTGFETFKVGLNDMIKGSEGKMGAFSRFYRNYAYDTYSQMDAMQGKMFSDELQLKYFIYNGGLIKNSRAFCIRKNGRVFSVDDTKSWIDEPDNKAKPPGYDPLIHRGGYGCRHSIHYITEDMAKALGYGQDDQVYKPFALKRFANGGEVITSDLVDVNMPDYGRVFNAANAFARMGHKVEIKPKIKNHLNPLYNEVYGGLKGSKYERKNPDLYIDGLSYEHEGFITSNPKNALRNMLNGGSAQSSRIIIDKPDLTDAYIKRVIKARNNSSLSPNEIDEVWILEGTAVRRIF